jgi:hypothetical protein
MTNLPFRVYRLRCGRKCHSAWMADEDEVWRIAIEKGLAYEDEDGMAGLGPLTWIEIGERRYERSRTFPVGGQHGVPRETPESDVGARLRDVAGLVLAGAIFAALLGWPLLTAFT